MKRQSRLLGKHWERLAEQYLVERGLVILERGYQCRLGELDLVALDANALVIVEVRYRGRQDFGSALESVTWHKQSRILRATRHYLMRHPHRAGLPLRFDVVAIDKRRSRPQLEWLRNAFGGA
jgi:putative endonuclease